ncbi:hypothetical protein COY27_06125 [Candidatus Woesearchaeota archaeon CG_4_10_14_0_2_um_filter_33_13]|nr:MAG: hypothetical protein COY27_06125 [Candidatus Woesearchaeota archaeon CG_4_10_14_0_2_um_filter_33_13]
MKKMFILVVIAIMVMTVFLIGCAEKTPTDGSDTIEVVDEDGALIGEATRSGSQFKLTPSLGSNVGVSKELNTFMESMAFRTKVVNVIRQGMVTTYALDDENCDNACEKAGFDDGTEVVPLKKECLLAFEFFNNTITKPSEGVEAIPYLLRASSCDTYANTITEGNKHYVYCVCI